MRSYVVDVVIVTIADAGVIDVTVVGTIVPAQRVF